MAAPTAPRSRQIASSIRATSIKYTTVVVALILRSATPFSSVAHHPHRPSAAATAPSAAFAFACTSHQYHHPLRIKPSLCRRTLMPQPGTRMSTITTTSTCLSSKSSSTNNAVADEMNDVRVRILCLHGKGGSGNQFVKSSLQPLRSLLEQRSLSLSEEQNKDRSEGGKQYTFSFEWEALTAPYELTPGNEAGGYSWWTMPPGVRSYNAEEYIGFDKSEAMVMDKLYSTTKRGDSTDTNVKNDNMAGECNFDIVLGHSQGAILTAALLSIHDKLWADNAFDKSDNIRGRPLGYILNGVAWPNPYKQSLESLATTTQQPPKRSESTNNTENDAALPRILFIMGKNDNINPIKSAMQVHNAFHQSASNNNKSQDSTTNVSIVNHDGGHSVPIGRDEDSIRALEEVVDWIVDIAQEKARRMDA